MQQYIRPIKNYFKLRFDPELRTIRKIILTHKDTSSGHPLIEECNRVFIDRLEVNPKALKLSFWKKHFEWQDLQKYPEIRGHLLDFGCGSGHSDIMLARQGYHVHGVDLSEIGIKIASYLRDREPHRIRERLSFGCSNIIEDLPPGELFDSAWASHVFEHIVNPSPILDGMRRWLKPGAFLLISVPFATAYDDPSHVNHYYTPEELRNTLEGHVTVKRVEYHESHQVLRAICQF